MLNIIFIIRSKLTKLSLTKNIKLYIGIATIYCYIYLLTSYLVNSSIHSSLIVPIPNFLCVIYLKKLNHLFLLATHRHPF